MYRTEYLTDFTSSIVSTRQFMPEDSKSCAITPILFAESRLSSLNENFLTFTDLMSFHCDDESSIFSFNLSSENPP